MRNYEVVIWLSLSDEIPAKGYWDQYVLERVLNEYPQVVASKIQGYKSAIVVIPGEYQGGYIEDINTQLATLEKCVVIITSDEHNNFPIHKLKHKNMKLFTMYGSKDNDIQLLPIGYPPELDTFRPKYAPVKDRPVYFSGQVNNASRTALLNSVASDLSGFLNKTGGFSQGVSRKEYYETMASAKAAPAPMGNISPDSFRLWEALEFGCVPIADNRWFWDGYFANIPFPIVSGPHQWDGYIRDAIEQYPNLNNEVQAWWLTLKASLLHIITGDTGDVVIVVPVSPISSHPDTAILEETIDSIRYHFPTETIVLTFDGVRDEQKEMSDDYQEHIRRVLWKCYKWGNIVPLLFPEHTHQVGMLRHVLNDVLEPFILYVEQDTPLVTDMSIDWEGIKSMLRSGESNLVRLHFETEIPKPHKHLMVGKPENGFQKTVQWSQRPHMATTAFYNRVLENNFSKNAKCFIEDKMHGVVINDFNKFGLAGWQQWRLHIYHPDGSIKRSYTTDGRAGGEKYDTTQIF